MAGFEYRKPVVAIFEPETSKVVAAGRFRAAGLFFLVLGIGCGIFAEVNWWLAGVSIGAPTSLYTTVLWLRSIAFPAVGLALLLAARVSQSSSPIMMVKAPTEE